MTTTAHLYRSPSQRLLALLDSLALVDETCRHRGRFFPRADARSLGGLADSILSHFFATSEAFPMASTDDVAAMVLTDVRIGIARAESEQVLTDVVRSQMSYRRNVTSRAY